jgi:hypothetical protein
MGQKNSPIEKCKTMKQLHISSIKLSGEVKNLLYRIELSSSTRQVSEEPTLTENTLRRWCHTDEEFRAACSLAGDLGIQLLK